MVPGLERDGGLEALMKSVIAEAGFASTLDMRFFESLRPRAAGSALWWFESVRRLRADARTVWQWMDSNGIVESELELWAEDPVHFGSLFQSASCGGLGRSSTLYYFNLEDESIPAYRASVIFDRERSAHWAKRLLFWPWQKLLSGFDARPSRAHVYEIGYSFYRRQLAGRRNRRCFSVRDSQSFPRDA